jgi:hypothetical protein
MHPRESNDNFTRFIYGVVWIVKDTGKRVLENRDGFFKGDSMFGEVRTINLTPI